MANYVCTVRTNYFHVKDPASFKEFMGCVYGNEDKVDLWEEKGDHGETVFGFGCYGGISGLYDAGYDDCDDEDEDGEPYDRFIDGLQKHVAPDDAIIIFESGWEKMCYVIGQAEIVTSDGYNVVNVTEAAIASAKKMLHKRKWITRYTY